MTQDVSVIIPNWNGAVVLQPALGALARQTLPPARVLVVDNGSTDQSIQIARAGGAEVVELGANHGFCRAVNEGIRRCETGWIAVLNNDVEVAPDWLERLMERVSDSYWFYAPRLLRHDDPTQIDGSFDLVSRAACAWRAGHGARDGDHWREERPIAFPPFTACLFRRSLFERVGLLEESFVSYLEDVDFGFRCALQGLPGLYVPAAAASHRGGATLGAWSGRMVRLLARNQVLLVARHFPDDWMDRYGAEVVGGQLLWGMLALRRGVFLSWLRGKIEGIAAYRNARGPVVRVAPAAFHRLVRDSERQIRELQGRGGFDWYWRVYFRWFGEAAS